MKQKITDFDKDDEQHWRAVLACGHRQHLRHDPPMTSRSWVLTEEGRASRIGFDLDCKLCDEEPGGEGHAGFVEKVPECIGIFVEREYFRGKG